MPDTTAEERRKLCGACGCEMGRHRFGSNACPSEKRGPDWHPTQKFRPLPSSEGK